jgi:hypothetical protein
MKYIQDTEMILTLEKAFNMAKDAKDLRIDNGQVFVDCVYVGYIPQEV